MPYYVKMPIVQNKERILKGTREKCQVTYKRKTIRLIAGHSAET
jgi:hypothetical protein